MSDLNRCPRCDRTGCLAARAGHVPVEGNAVRAMCPACVADDDCAAHAVNWRSRAIAAEQRDSAAEQERDRMRPVVEAAGPMRDSHEGCVVEPDCGACFRCDFNRAYDAYRAGQPAPSEAEQIAAWLEETSMREDLVADIRAGAWRKEQS